MTKLTWELYTNARRQTCCAGKCKGCPYVKKWQGGCVGDGSNAIHPWVLEQFSLITVNNARNAEFKNYPDKDAIVLRLRQWNQRLRNETEQRLRIKIDPATKEDFMKYFGYVD